MPRSKRNQISGRRDDRVVVRVTAPPADGKANAAVCAIVAEAAGIPKRRVSVVRGAKSRDKSLRLEGVDDAELRRVFGI